MVISVFNWVFLLLCHNFIVNIDVIYASEILWDQ